jgi:hypothetical protein
MAHQANQQVQECIKNCLDCYQTCLREAMNHCLEAGDKHVEPAHMRLMLSCAEMCRTAAHFMLSNSPLHQQTCGTCADVCEACAKSCESVADMDECVQACRRCAESCRNMAGTSSAHALSGSASQISGSSVKAPM